MHYSFPCFDSSLPLPLAEGGPHRDILAFWSIFEELQDPRRDHLKRFPLNDILVLVVMGRIAACEDWVDIADYGADHIQWFQFHGLFPDGSPSHDTLSRVFRLLDSSVFHRCCSAWLRPATQPVVGVIAIDGKTSRASGDGDRAHPIHTVSAFSTDLGLTLAHVAVAEKSNEIPAVPELLEMIAVKGNTITMDTMGCQRSHVDMISARGGWYVLPVKGNQPGTAAALETFFTDASQRAWAGVDHTQAIMHDIGHGRKEVRQLWACPVQRPWLDA